MNIRMLSTLLAAAVMCLGVSGPAAAQLANPFPQITKQVAAPVPKLALMGAASAAKAGVQYHKIVLSITNRDKYETQMFVLPDGVKLPPNPCGGVRTRVVSAVFDERGTILSKCMPVANRDSLGAINFLIQKGSAIPKFVYVVLTDLGTGGAYRSNLVSPSTGATK